METMIKWFNGDGFLSRIMIETMNNRGTAHQHGKVLAVPFFRGNSSRPVHSPSIPTRLSAAYKPYAGKLVVGWVTTSESSLLYVFRFCFFASLSGTLGEQHTLEAPPYMFIC
ncbi:hypothetical protein ACN38_g2519 [Penicillium nordicum]|uniref:Uncharacterized protein n=1 Tax=Penicillium nordicum TaxID=229535 RepID=A0A0M8P743_9EURO|nr:hypothetical protein ACN38_g2519 [Penicillium nordicum]